MKKLLSVIMIAAITLGMSAISLEAEEVTITPDSGEQSGKINVDYNADVSYLVTIPASVTFTDTQTSVERGLLARDVLLKEGSSLNISITSLNDFKMKKGEAFIEYALSVNHNDALEKNNFTILTVESGEHTGWAVLEFTTELRIDDALYTGTYSDILTFTVSIDEN